MKRQEVKNLLERLFAEERARLGIDEYDVKEEKKDEMDEDMLDNDDNRDNEIQENSDGSNEKQKVYSHDENNTEKMNADKIEPTADNEEINEISSVIDLKIS